MGENLDNYSYNGSADGFEQNLANEIKDVLKNDSDILNKQGEDVIKSLDKNKLASYIETSFKTADGWMTYAEMKNHAGKFHGFMTQAAIDMLGSLDNYKDKKYDINGNIDNNGQTIDDWLKVNGGIDNQYGGGTRKVVKMVQHILGVHEDGAAGPQFFAKICAVLKGETVDSSSFKVRNRENYNYNFNSSQQSVSIPSSSTEGVDAATEVVFTMPSGYKIGTINNGKIPILTNSGSETGCFIEKSANQKYVIGNIDGYNETVSGKFSINSETNEITYEGPTNVEQGIQAKEQAIRADLNKIDGNYDLKAAVQDLNGNITYVTLGNGSLSVYNDFSGDRAKIDLNNSVVYKDYKNSDFYKNIYSSIEVTGGNWLDDISHTKFEDIQPILNDYPNLDGNFSTENYIDIGTRIPRHTRWYESYRQKLGSRFVGRNIGDGHPSGRDFVDWCNYMKTNKCTNYGKLTISEWIAFSTKFSKDSISKIYM